MKLFFASDIHGSTTCFRKLVNAGAFYGVDYLIMGGDLAGKELVPLVDDEHGGWTATFRGSRFQLDSAAEAQEFENRAGGLGAYTMRTDADFVQQLRDSQELVETTVHRLALERTEQWVEFAAKRLGDQKRPVELLLGLGNDDFDDMVELLDNGPVRYAADGPIQLGLGFTLASIGWSNLTPWRTNRECDEQELERKVDLLRRAGDPGTTIFNIHVPPYDSGLDSAPKLAEDLQIELVGGQPDMVPVGSTAVAEGVRDFQPVVSLHGHIHEGRGVVKVGSSTVVNPGSEYDQGSLLGVIVDVKPGRVKRCQLVAG